MKTPIPAEFPTAIQASATSTQFPGSGWLPRRLVGLHARFPPEVPLAGTDLVSGPAGAPGPAPRRT